MIARREQHVGGLDVAVHEPRGMGRIERAAELGDDRRSARRSKRPFAPHEAPAVVADDVSHCQIRNACFLARDVNRDHVRMVDRSRELGFLQEPAARGRILEQLGSDDLQCNGPVEVELRGSVHDAHAAAPHHRLDAMAGEYRADRQVAHWSCIAGAADARQMSARRAPPDHSERR